MRQTIHPFIKLRLKRSLPYRCNNDAQLFHDFEWFSIDSARGLQPDCDERVGRCLHVLHLRQPPGVRVCQLRGPETPPPQYSLQARREPRHAGKHTY